MMMFLKRTALVLGAIAIAAAAPSGPSPEGRWMTEMKSGVVEVFRCGDALCGRLAWFRIKPNDPNPQGLDLKNPDPSRRRQSLCGLVFMTGFKPAEPDFWKDGTIYDPSSGSTYHATMRLEADGTLRLRGYIVISLIGASEVWTRYTAPPPQCPAH